MQTKTNHQLLTSIKLLFVSGALTAIIWLWGWFANRTIQNYNQQNQVNSSSTNASQVNVVVANSNGQTVSDPSTVTLRQVSALNNSGTFNQAPLVITSSGNSAPVTRTGSSRP